MIDALVIENYLRPTQNPGPNQVVTAPIFCINSRPSHGSLEISHLDCFITTCDLYFYFLLGLMSSYDCF